MAQQTAVEWLENEMQKTYIFNQNDFDMFKQAKEIEKQQIIDFTNNFIAECTYGDYDGLVQRSKTAELYYNETYKQ